MKAVEIQKYQSLRIQLLSTEKLEILGEELIDFSAISDLLTLLEQQENS